MQQLTQNELRIGRKARTPGAARACAAVATACLSASAGAIDFGPFTLNGFFQGDVGRISANCEDNSCQVDPQATKQFIWADPVVQGKGFGAGTTSVTLFQPYLGVKFDLPEGFKISGLISQRWRDFQPDWPGYYYDLNIALSHEDYGSLRIGAMTTRSWSMADYPFGTDIGLGYPWSSSGAGYGLLTRAVRYTSPVFDVAEGDLVVEGTYDFGESGWQQNKPRFLELWVHYGRRDLSLDFIAQDTRNGTPSAFGQTPFTGLFYDNAFDSSLGGSGQSIAMLMARYRATTQFELLGGLRGNRWSGAYAVLLQSRTVNPGGFDIWNNPFNVDWGTDLGGGVYKGYSATSVDAVLGGRYRFAGEWTVYGGVLYLGKASTDNPSERGQSNSATLGTIGLEYDFGNGLRARTYAGVVHYGQKGLSPMSMASNSVFTDIDSRLVQTGNWFGAGLIYTF
jgi:predicted porin